MKPIIKQSLLFTVVCFLSILTISSCKEEPTFELGESFSQVVGISDDWVLLSVTQVDETNCSDDNKMDVSEILIGATPATVSFTQDGNFSANQGTSKLQIPEGGTWMFDDDRYPTEVQLTSSSGLTILALGAPVRENVDEQLIIKYSKPLTNCFYLECRKEPVEFSVSYIYTFDRQ